MICLERKIETRQLVNIITLFLVVQFAGLLIAIFSTASLQFYVQSSSTQLNSVEAALFYTAYILLSAAVILIIFKFYHGNLIFKLLEALVVFFATGSVIFMILSTLFPSANPYYIIGISAAAVTALIAAKNAIPRLRNLLAISSSIGVGILIGLNGFELAFMLMFLIAIYDYVAVFVTKHMITMAKGISSRNLAFLIGSSDVEAMPSKYLTKAEMREFKSDTKGREIKDPIVKGLLSDGIVTVVSQVQLGSGDLAIPLMVAVSAYISFLSYFAAIMVIAGGACGMVFTMYLLKRYKVALPAIPPLFAFICLFLGLLFAINDIWQYQIWLGFFALFAITVLVLIQKLRKVQQK